MLAHENSKVPEVLSVPRFYERIIDTALVRGPMGSHQLAMEKAPIAVIDTSGL